jgi:four helix bundle protein
MKNRMCGIDHTGQQYAGLGESRGYADLSERLLTFAVRVGKVVNALPATRLGRHIASQLIRSGTSAAPNYEEGCAAESRADFVHKLSISLKELRESRFWIRLIVESDLLPQKKMMELQDECLQLYKIIAQSIVTAKSNVRKRG